MGVTHSGGTHSRRTHSGWVISGGILSGIAAAAGLALVLPAAGNAPGEAIARIYELRGVNAEVAEDASLACSGKGSAVTSVAHVVKGSAITGVITGRPTEKGEARFALEVVFPGWEENTYLMLPGGAYNGNRDYEIHGTDSHVLWERRFREGDYQKRDRPRFVSQWTVPVTGLDGKGVIEGGVGDLATPAAAFYFPKAKKGVIVYFEPQVAGRYTGFYFTNGLFRVQYPARNYEYMRYDGKGDRTRDDPPIAVEPLAAEPIGHLTGKSAESRLASRFEIVEFGCESIPALFRKFFDTRKPAFLDCRRAKLPTAKEHDYLRRLAVNAIVTAQIHGGKPDNNYWWTSGWCGGPIVAAGLCEAGWSGAKEFAGITLDFMAETQEPSGLFRGVSKDGRRLPERKLPETENFQLSRRSADGLYYAFDLLRVAGSTPVRAAALRRCADAFTGIFERCGEIPEYIDVRDATPVIRGSTGAAILPAALLRAADYFGEPRYAECAKKIAEQFWQRYVSRGFCFGGAGDASDACDSESCCEMLVSFVDLAEKIGEKLWLDRAETTAHILSTWIVSYRFPFPPKSEFTRIGVNSVGSVIANLQNRHAAPGFCINSGECLLRLAKLTRDRRYRELYEDVFAFIPQVISTPERPIMGSLAVKIPRQLNYGSCHERVNLSGWEGMESVGETYWRAAWCTEAFFMMPPLYEE